MLLQFSNLWFRLLFRIVLVDYDWIFLPVANLICKKWSTHHTNEVKSSVEENSHHSSGSLHPVISMVSLVPMLPPHATLPTLEDMLASKILVLEPSPAITPAIPDPISRPESFGGPSSPFQRRSLIPTLNYMYGWTKGSPREDWYKAKENFRKEILDEVEKSFHISDKNEDTGPRRLPLSMSLSHTPVIDSSLDESSILRAASVTSRRRKDDDDREVPGRLHEPWPPCPAPEDEITNDTSIGDSLWDNLSRGTVDDSTLEMGGSSHATIDGDDESWVVEGALAMNSSRVREIH